MIIEDQAVAISLADAIEQAMNEDNSWRLDLHEGDIRWHSGTESWKIDPETGNGNELSQTFYNYCPLRNICR